jgi:hypothetical protein
VTQPIALLKSYGNEQGFAMHLTMASILLSLAH